MGALTVVNSAAVAAAIKAGLVHHRAGRLPEAEDADKFDLWLRLGPVYDILRYPETHTPLTVAVCGDWGVGKTSAMRWLEGRLNPNGITATIACRLKTFVDR